MKKTPFFMSTLPDRLTFSVRGVSFSLRLISHGTFLMGADPDVDPDADEVESPVHPVTISRDFYLAETPVTQALYEAVMDCNPSVYKGASSRPVDSVSWFDSQAFIEKLNSIIPDGSFSLPTEAEWEFAARGGNLSKGFKYAGSDDIDEVAWYYFNCNTSTCPVAQKLPNELGLYDMTGNVIEWCQDWWTDDYPSDAVTDPVGPAEGIYRVQRGGGYHTVLESCRNTFRDGFFPTNNYDCFGFRLLFRPSTL